MSETRKAFEQGLADMSALARDSKFRECFDSSRDLAASAGASGFKHGVFIAEVLERVFLQIGPLFLQSRALPQDRAGMLESMNKSLSLLSSAYRRGDRAGAHDALESLWLDADEFRLKYAKGTHDDEHAGRAWTSLPDPGPAQNSPRADGTRPEPSDDAKTCIQILESVMGRPGNPNITAKDLDSMLADCVDEKEDSVELIRSVRDRHC